MCEREKTKYDILLYGPVLTFSNSLGHVIPWLPFVMAFHHHFSSLQTYYSEPESPALILSILYFKKKSELFVPAHYIKVVSNSPSLIVCVVLSITLVSSGITVAATTTNVCPSALHS